MDVLISILLSLTSFIGVSIIWFLKLIFTKVEKVDLRQQKMQIDIELLKAKNC